MFRKKTVLLTLLTLIGVYGAYNFATSDSLSNKSIHGDLSQSSTTSDSEEKREHSTQLITHPTEPKTEVTTPSKAVNRSLRPERNPQKSSNRVAQIKNQLAKTNNPKEKKFLMQHLQKEKIQNQARMNHQRLKSRQRFQAEQKGRTDNLLQSMSR